MRDSKYMYVYLHNWGNVASGTMCISMKYIHRSGNRAKRSSKGD